MAGYKGARWGVRVGAFGGHAEIRVQAPIENRMRRIRRGAEPPRRGCSRDRPHGPPVAASAPLFPVARTLPCAALAPAKAAKLTRTRVKGSRSKAGEQVGRKRPIDKLHPVPATMSAGSLWVKPPLPPALGDPRRELDTVWNARRRSRWPWSRNGFVGVNSENPATRPCPLAGQAGTFFGRTLPCDEARLQGKPRCPGRAKTARVRRAASARALQVCRAGPMGKVFSAKPELPPERLAVQTALDLAGSNEPARSRA
jgi:hypothetical protein